MSKKVTVVSNNYSEIIINIPELRLNRVWEKKGAKKMIDYDVLQEALYDPGVEYMFKHGMLYIEDDKVNEDLGINEDSTESGITAVLPDDQKQRYLYKLPVADFKIAFSKLDPEEQQTLARFAIDNKQPIDLNKNKYILQVTHIDINQIIEQYAE